MWTAADAPGMDTALITAVWTFLGIVVTTLGAIAVSANSNRKNREPATTAPPSPANGNGVALLEIAKDIGQLDQRADDSDDRDDMQDRRLERIESYLDDDDPDWRRR